MRNARRSATAALLGATAGALLSSALLGGPIAHADDLPVPPFDYDQNFGAFLPSGSGTPGAITNGSPYNPDVTSFDQAYATPGSGSFEVHETDTNLIIYNDETQQVISSDGAAPAVGTVWDNSEFHFPIGTADFEIYSTSSLTTPDGMVDVFSTNGPWDNIYYQGPDGNLDYLVDQYDPSQAAIQVFDFPAAGDTAAAINPADLVGLGDAGSLTTMLTDIQSLF
jgi:hypothetical protein